jgi:hypothetical protein
MKIQQNEKPKDQEWVHYPEFEKKLYDTSAKFPQAKPITFGPKFHWFSYYDKFQTDPADRFVLGMEVDFDNRSPRENDIIKIGMIDIKDSNKWIELDETRSWCWQQGCMLQWRPASNNEIMWNDRIKDKFVCHILDVFTREKKTVEHPIYHVRPDGKSALSLDFSRLQILRPGYGYPGVKCKNADKLKPEDTGISLIDLETGKEKLLFSVADIANIDYPDCVPDDDIHYFNAPAWNPDGSRFLFLHRWRSISGRFPDFRTRMFTASADGSDLKLVTDKPYISHFTWRADRIVTICDDPAYCGREGVRNNDQCVDFSYPAVADAGDDLLFVYYAYPNGIYDDHRRGIYGTFVPKETFGK